jgi:SAM-dependent methyltransferase
LEGTNDDIIDAIVWNKETKDWYFVEERLLDLLPPAFSYPQDRKLFFQKYENSFTQLGLQLDEGISKEFNKTAKSVLEQQEHFDEYSGSEKQSYSEYENSPFWKAADNITYSHWNKILHYSSPKDKLLVDIGSAQGRSCQYFHDHEFDIVGLDISKECLRLAIKRYPFGKSKARYHFIATDCSLFPFQEEVVDYVLIYGVLHHLPKPGESSAEIVRILKKNGLYFGSENHKSILRFIFDFLMLIRPQWYEKAGSEPLIGREDYDKWIKDDQMEKDYSFSVYVPPHLVNLLGHKIGRYFFKFTEMICNKLSFFNKFAGLITIVAKKR